MEDFSEAQKKFMHNLFAKLNGTIHEKTSEIRSELSDIKEEIASTISNLNEKLDKLEKENHSLLKDKLFLERKIRKNNVIIFGIDQDTPVVESIISLFNDLLGVQVKITDLNDFYRLKTNTNTNNSPVVVEFLSYQQKLEVLRNAKKLKGKKISISKDLCKEDQKTNKILLKHQKEARHKGKTAFIKGNKLLIENDVYTIDQLLRSYSPESSFIEIKQKIDSAPSTPNPTRRQKQLMQELGLEEEKQDERKSRAKITNTKRIIEDPHKIKTRSNSTTNK